MNETKKSTERGESTIQEKEKLTFKENTLFVMGILTSIVGGYVGSHLTIFSRDMLLKNPFLNSIITTCMVFLFSTFIFLLLNLYKAEEGQNMPDFLVSAWKSDWKYYLSFTVFICALTFMYLYSNATTTVM